MTHKELLLTGRVAIKANSQEEKIAIFNAGEAMGIQSKKMWVYDEGWPFVAYSGGSLVGVTDYWKPSSEKDVIFFNSLSEFFARDPNKVLPSDKTVKLNSKYTAIVTKEKVKVGCQEFTHESILELAQVILTRRRLSLY